MHQYLATLAPDLWRLSIWIVILLIIFIPLERLCSQRRQPVVRPEFFIDLGYFFLNGLLPKLLLILPLSAIAWGVHHFAPSGLLYIWASQLSLRTRLVLAVIVGDLGTYWGHRWSHQNPLLWRFHAIHHSAKAMDWLVNTRAHPLDLVFTRVCGLVPLYLLGLAQPTDGEVDLVPVLYALCGYVWSFIIHANLGWRFGWLERAIATPAFHHWHHANDERASIDTNYAAIFPIFDIIFGTFYLPKRWPKQYGIETNMPSDLTGQLLQPLGLHRSKLEN